MRYYRLILRSPSGLVAIPTPAGTLGLSPAAFYTFTSHPSGLFGLPDPGALDVEFDLPVYPMHTIQGGSLIRVWGIGLPMIGQAANLSGYSFELYGGMGPGLPLANPAQADLLAQGTVWQAYGEWEGTDQTLELLCNPGNASALSGVVFSWLAGQPLETAITAALTQALPGFLPPVISIIPGMVTPRGENQAGSYATLEDFASWLNDFTRPLGVKRGLPEYPGVRISVQGRSVLVYDTTQVPTTGVKPLQFQDLVGQPTWLGPVTISFKTVLRGDLAIGDRVLMPPGLYAPYALTSPAAAVPNAPARSRSVFQGAFVIQEVHHFARFRQADASSWATAFTAISTQAPAGQVIPLTVIPPE